MASNCAVGRIAGLATAAWVVLACVGAMAASAQETSLYGGMAHAQYGDSLSGTAGTASLRLRSYRALTAFDLQGTVSQFTTGEWAAQAGGNATHFWRVSGRTALGLTASGSYADFEAGPASGFGTAGPMVAVSGRTYLLSLGVSGGATRSINETTYGTIASAVRGRVVPTDGVSVDLGWFGTRAGDTLSFADLSAGVAWSAGPVMIAASAGMRMGDLDDDPWGQVRVEITPLTALRFEVAAGRYPRDLTGFTDGLFLQGGLRLVLGRPSPRLTIPAPGVVADRIDNGRVRLTLRFSGDATALAIAGDFSAWDPVPLRRIGDDRWTTTLVITPGVHTYAVIADGTWTLPDGVAGVDDEFGGKVGILVVQQ
jgi:hypothetical protein